MRDTGNRECSIIFNPRGCRINMSPLCLTASFPAKYFYNISILIWRKPRKYFDKKFQFPNYDPGCFRSYFPLYLTIFQSGFCPQVLCASQRGGGGGGGGWGGEAEEEEEKEEEMKERRRRRRRTLTQNTTLPHNSHTQLRPLAHKMCNFQHTSRKCSQFSTAREIYRERGRTWVDCALKAFRAWHKQSNITQTPKSKLTLWCKCKHTHTHTEKHTNTHTHENTNTHPHINKHM